VRWAIRGSNQGPLLIRVAKVVERVVLSAARAAYRPVAAAEVHGRRRFEARVDDLGLLIYERLLPALPGERGADP
jgi:hypothetical protein